MKRCASFPIFDAVLKDARCTNLPTVGTFTSAKSATSIPDLLQEINDKETFSVINVAPEVGSISHGLSEDSESQLGVSSINPSEQSASPEPILSLIAYQPNNGNFFSEQSTSRRSSETPELASIVEEDRASQSSSDDSPEEIPPTLTLERSGLLGDMDPSESEQQDEAIFNMEQRSQSQSDNKDIKLALFRAQKGRIGSVDLRACQSQIFEPPKDEMSEAKIMDKSLSTSTPSIDVIGDEKKDLKKEKPEKSQNGTVGHRKKEKPKTPMFMAPHQVVIMPSKNKQPNRSFSSVGKEQSESKEKLVRSSTGSKGTFSSFMRFRPGSTKNKKHENWRQKAIYQRDSRSGSEPDHNFISVSCSNYSSLCDKCEKKLMRLPNSGQAMRCTNCDMQKHRNGDGKSASWSGSDFDNLQNTASGSGYIEVSGDKVEVKVLPNLELSAWSDLNLWSKEPEAWSLAHKDVAKNLNKKEVKRQDVIYELYLTEKHHCETLVVLKQIYWEVLSNSDFVSEKELNQLIPNVFEELLEFHLDFHRQLKKRREISVCVSDISDILESLSISSNSLYKERTLPDCLLLITQRLTKYPVLVDQLLKHESSDRKERFAKVASIVKQMTSDVDKGLANAELNKRWKMIQSRLDAQSTATLHGKRFTFQDLTKFEDRQIRCSGSVLWQNALRKPVEVQLLLFDDVIVFLTNTTPYNFFSQDNHEPILSLTNLLIREKAGKGHAAGILLIVLPPVQPDMYEIMFRTRQELKTWYRALAEAIDSRKQVRRIKEPDLPKESIQEVDEVDKWLVEFKNLFTSRQAEEQKLKDYLIGRINWYGEVRKKLKSIPQRRRHDLSERVRDVLKTELHKIRSHRQAALHECVRRAEEVHDDWLLGPFDDAWDAGSEFVDGDEEAVEEDTNPHGPRRNETFHGQDDIGNDKLKPTNVIRRHTTVPKIHEEDESGNTETVPEEDSTVGEERRKRSSSMKDRESIEMFMKDNAELRRQNNLMYTDLMSMTTQLTLEKERSKPATMETLEKLRQAQTDLQLMQSKINKENEEKQCRLEEIETRLNERQSQVEAEEQDLDNKWKAYYDKYNRTPNHPQFVMSSTPVPNDSSNILYSTPARGTPSPLVTSHSMNSEEDSAMVNSNSMSDVTSPLKPIPQIQSYSSLPSSKSSSELDRRQAPGHLLGIVNQQHGLDPPKQQIPNIGDSVNNNKKSKDRRDSVSPASRLLPSGQQQIFPKQLAQPTGKKGKKIKEKK